MRIHHSNKCFTCFGPISYAIPSPKNCRKCNDKNRTKSIHERFWKYVKKTPTCWLWTGSKSRGYGQLNAGNGKSPHKAYRLSWELHNGIIPKHIEVLHNCPGGDTPACVNPSHLKLGTHKENMEDASKKGQMARGEQITKIGLTNKIVKEIRNMHIPYKTGYKDVAKFFCITWYTVRDICQRKTWKHI